MQRPGRKPREPVARDLARLEGLAFRRGQHCGKLVKGFREMEGKIDAHPHSGPLWNIYEWLLAPFSLWPIDFAGLGSHVLEEISAGRELDEELRWLLEMLDKPPAAETQAAVAEFEHYVQSGRYEDFLNQPEKFEEQEKLLLEDGELARAWSEIKRRHEPARHQNARGVIRRRMSQERNFREDRELDWRDVGQRFRLCFDAMCYRWKLYGMEGDRPLLLKLSVNPTPHGTMIVIPRHWSLDPHRDLNWRFIGKLHRSRGARRQGPKLSTARMERLEEARQARKLWGEAGRRGLRGDQRYDYVRERMGRDARMDPSWLRRLLGLKVGTRKL